MKHKELFDKAYERLVELYSGEYHSPDAKILSRFYGEKMILQESELYMRYLDFFGRVREVAERKGEHVWVRGTAGSSFIAYLLGATDINPLPRHEYCPHCRITNFIGEGTPFDGAPKKCPCGEDILFDGHNIPFESNLKSVLSGHIQLGVSCEFFEEAKRMIYDEMWDKAIVTLRNGDIAPTWFCFLNREENDDGDYMLSGNSELFGDLPKISLVPNKTLDKYREIETVTGVKMDDAYSGDKDVFSALADGKLDGIPNINTEIIKELFQTFKPQDYDDMLKLIGYALGSCIGDNQSEKPLAECGLPLSNVPVFREDMYDMICEKLRDRGIYEVGLAYEVAQNTRRGVYARKGLDESTRQVLLSLGFNTEFCSYIEKVTYMFPKAHAASYLRDAIAMMWYKLHYPDEYSRIFMNRSEEI